MRVDYHYLNSSDSTMSTCETYFTEGLKKQDSRNGDWTELGSMSMDEIKKSWWKYTPPDVIIQWLVKYYKAINTNSTPPAPPITPTCGWILGV